MLGACSEVKTGVFARAAGSSGKVRVRPRTPGGGGEGDEGEPETP